MPIAPLDGFNAPIINAPIDVDAYVAAVPPSATVKGTVLQSAIDVVKSRGLPAPPTKRAFVAFRDYPMREFLELTVTCARTLAPEASLGEGLRQLGGAAFTAFAGSVIGRVVYGVFGDNVASVFKVANKGYEMTQNVGKVRTDSVDLNAVRLTFTRSYSFLSTYHYGIIESALAASGVEGGIWYRPSTTSLADGEYYVAWNMSAARPREQNRASAR